MSGSEVQQLIFNLCTNAWLSLSGSSGTVSISLSKHQQLREETLEVGRLRPGSYARISIADTGCGIPAHALERLFEPFFTTRSAEHGTGLGLHIVQSIVSTHDGAIHVDTVEGRGTTFTILVPSQELSTAEVSHRLKPPADRGTGQRVAYVDDDPVVRLMVERVLENAGYQVNSFDKAVDFLQALQQRGIPFDIVVTDFQMPDIDGLEVARLVRQSRPSLPVVITSGYVSDELAAQAARLGVSAILNKEQTYEELSDLIAKILAAV